MKRSALALALAVITFTASAADERAAAAVVKKYSEAIACQFADKGSDRNQYKAVTLIAGDKELLGMGSVHVVYWLGDVGCAGGNETLLPNFTVVEHNGFMSASPVVVPDYKLPDLDLRYVTSVAGKDGVLLIQGLAYGSNDQPGRPQKRVSYALSLDQDKRTFIKR